MDAGKLNNDTTLKPCPFCGASASMRHGARYGHWVQCDKCGAGHPLVFDDEAGAVAAWNGGFVPMGTRITYAEWRNLEAERIALENAVRTMRAAQKEYFRTRAPSALNAAKQAERAVDALLDKADEDKANAGKPRQGELL